MNKYYFHFILLIMCWKKNYTDRIKILIRLLFNFKLKKLFQLFLLIRKMEKMDKILTNTIFTLLY